MKLKRILFQIGRMKFWPQFFKCGWHSGYPLCCILYWILYFDLQDAGFWRNYWTTARHEKYVECPMCKWLKPKIRTVKKCDCGEKEKNRLNRLQITDKAKWLEEFKYYTNSGL